MVESPPSSCSPASWREAAGFFSGTTSASQVIYILVTSPFKFSQNFGSKTMAEARKGVEKQFVGSVAVFRARRYGTRRGDPDISSWRVREKRRSVRTGLWAPHAEVE